MSKIALRQVYFKGITMQIPEVWEYDTEEYTEEDGTKSFSLSVNATGKDVRSLDISWGIIPKGSDSYTEACATYEEVAGEEDLAVDEEPIVCFEFQKREAHGFSVVTDDGLPCFFFCVSQPSGSSNNLLTVLACAANNEELQSLIDYTEEYLKVE